MADLALGKFPHFVKHDKPADYRWTIYDADPASAGAKVVLKSTEGYTTPANRDANLFRKISGDTWTIYKGNDGLIWWRVKASNGEIVLGSLTGFLTSKASWENACYIGFSGTFASWDAVASKL